MRPSDGVRAFVAVILNTFVLSACDSSPTEPEEARGGFEDAMHLAGGSSALRSLRARDVTGDGLPDLIATLGGNAGVRVWRNDPAGGFAPPVDHAFGADAVDVAAGDVNGDGRIDLIAVAHFANALYVRLGTGSGEFGAPTAYPLRNHGRRLRIADLNRDGFDDVVAVHDGSGQPIYISVFLGSANGPMRSTWESASVFSNARDLALGDFNGDGALDLAIATGDDRASLLLHYGRGDGHFSAGVAIESDIPGIPDGMTRIDAGDMNEDGIDDIVSAHYEPSHQLAFWFGSSAGVISSERVGHDGPGDVALADFDRDGALDVAGTHLDLGELTLLFGRGDGSFRAVPPRMVDPGAADIAAGDFNGDGRPDLAILSVTSNRVRVLLNRSAA